MLHGNILSWLATFLAGLVTFCVVKFLLLRKDYPPGPIPLPIFGNLFKIGFGKSMKSVIEKLKTQYGGIFTLWFSDLPFVIVTDWKLTKEALIDRRNDFGSRPNFRSIEILRKYLFGVVLEPTGRNWEIGRKISALAVRKFADGENLAHIVSDATTKFTKKMLAENKSIEPSSLIQVLLIDIISETAFGSGSLSEEEYKQLTKMYDALQSLIGNTPGDGSIFLRPFFYHKEIELVKVSINFNRFLSEKYKANKDTFQRGVIRNFSDAIITAALEAQEENKESKDFLNESNMVKIIGALYLAGTDTTATTFRWMVLFLCAFPEVQIKIKEEIDQKIGQRMPLQGDRLNCPYTWAFISETLRYASPLPGGVPHAVNVDSELGGYKIKKGTTIIFRSDILQMDPQNFEEPQKFKPDRFMKPDGSYNNERIKGFLAFGEGKRICVGEKMARNDLFLMLVNVVQKIEISLENDIKAADLEPQSNVAVNVPKLYKIRISTRK